MRHSGLAIGIGVLAAAFLLRAAKDAGAEEPSGALALKTDRVVVFKDGHGLFVKTGTGTADADGRVSTDAVPDAAVLGCFWASSATADRKILGMRSEWVETKEMKAKKDSVCITTLEILRANVGKRVTLGLLRDKAPDVNVTGKVVEVLDLAPEDPPPPPPGHRPAPGPAGTTRRPIVPGGGTLVVVEEEAGGRLVLPVADVRTISGPDLSTRMWRTEEVVTRSKRLSFDLGKDAAGKPATVRIVYFAEGVRWIPSYRVGGGLEKDAEMALQGEVLNEAEDLVDAALDLVVGVPSFKFKDVVSPLTLERAMRESLRQAAPQLVAQMAGNMFRNDAGQQVEWGEGGGGLEMAPELAAEASQDLFVYGVGKVSLPEGSRATYPLWQSTSSLRHVYTMDVQVVRNAQSGEHHYQSAKMASVPAAERGRRPFSVVWHEVELSNASKVPWTTGAALLLKNDVPLGQDILGYTPVGGKTLLPVTVAVDLQGKYEEKEVERKSNALNWSSRTFSLVRKQGILTLTSYRKEPSAARVTVSVGGKAEAADGDAKIVLNDMRADDWPGGGAFSVNNHSDLSWDLTLAPGETKTLTYTFSFYVP